MGWASRHRWDMRAIEFFRLFKLEGEESALRYRAQWIDTNQFEKALGRVMQRANYVKEQNDRTPHGPVTNGGLPDGGALPKGGPEAAMENGKPTSGEPS